MVLQELKCLKLLRKVKYWQLKVIHIFEHTFCVRLYGNGQVYVSEGTMYDKEFIFVSKL